MKIAKYNGGMFGNGTGDTIRCCLCGDANYENMYVEKLGIAIGMSGNDYTFCKKCWLGKNLGKRLLQLLEYPDGMHLVHDSVTITEIDNEK